jgi:hypothetical protein
MDSLPLDIVHHVLAPLLTGIEHARLRCVCRALALAWDTHRARLPASWLPALDAARGRRIMRGLCYFIREFVRADLHCTLPHLDETVIDAEVFEVSLRWPTDTLCMINYPHFIKWEHRAQDQSSYEYRPIFAPMLYQYNSLAGALPSLIKGLSAFNERKPKVAFIREDEVRRREEDVAIQERLPAALAARRRRATPEERFREVLFSGNPARIAWVNTLGIDFDYDD